MYEQYSKETQDKIKDLGLWGKSSKEIVVESVKACIRMRNDISMVELESLEVRKALIEIETFLYDYAKTLK
ncbi:MAG: hypothetical protein E7A06_06220 [Clostridiales bacterium]|nr:hypothetical protein [Clostridiales bacterium]